LPTSEPFVLSDQELWDIARLHVHDQFGSDWKASHAVPLADPDGVFFRVERVDGLRYTGAPGPFFVYRDSGRVVLLGPVVPHLSIDELEHLKDNHEYARALVDPRNPRHAEVVVPYIRRELELAKNVPELWIDRYRSTS
jgi:hypothetical protein